MVGVESYFSNLSHSVTHTHTFGRTPLDGGSARRRDLYLTTHNTHKIHTSMRSAGFEPAIPAAERPLTHALNRRSALSISVSLISSLSFEFLRSCWWVVCFTILSSLSPEERAQVMDFGEYWCLPRVCKLASN